MPTLHIIVTSDAKTQQLEVREFHPVRAWLRCYILEDATTDATCEVDWLRPHQASALTDKSHALDLSAAGSGVIINQELNVLRDHVSKFTVKPSVDATTSRVHLYIDYVEKDHY